MWPLLEFCATVARASTGWPCFGDSINPARPATARLGSRLGIGRPMGFGHAEFPRLVFGLKYPRQRIGHRPTHPRQ